MLGGFNGKDCRTFDPPVLIIEFNSLNFCLSNSTRVFDMLLLRNLFLFLNTSLQKWFNSMILIWFIEY